LAELLALDAFLGDEAWELAFETFLVLALLADLANFWIFFIIFGADLDCFLWVALTIILFRF